MDKTKHANQLPTLWEVDDELWERIAPMLVIHKPRKKAGRPRQNDRAILNALIWMERSGAQWGQLPRPTFPAKSTVNDRLHEWVEHGNLERVWALLLSEYDDRFGLAWTWQAADGCIIKAPLGKKGDPEPSKASAGTPRTGASSGANDTA